MYDDDNKDDREWRNCRLVDIVTIVGMLAVLILGYRLLTPRWDSPAQTSYIVPSQHVHW